MANFEVKDVVEGLLRSVSGDNQFQPQVRGSPVRIPGSNRPMPMDEVLARLPRRKLTKDDFKNPELMKMKMKADHEASLPPEHIPLLNRNQIMGTLEATRQFVDENRFQKSQVLVERKQIYSSAKLEDLSRINLSDLMVRKRHKGKYLLCRTFLPAVFDGGIGILLGVEDPQGDAAYMKLFNYALLLEAAKEEHDANLPIGTILIIREPTYITDTVITGLPYVNVDSPSDVVFVDPNETVLSDVSWKTTLTVPPRPSTGEAWKAQALKHFKASQWFSAAICFSNCLKFGYDEQVSRLNRAEVYLRLGWNNSALHDAQDAFKSGTLSDDLILKAVVRIIKAQYAMGRYGDVLETAKSLPDDKIVVDWVARAKQRIEEQKTGNYDWLKFIKAGKSAYSPDIADFTGPVEFKKGPNGVRGTFVTRKVKTGELLMLHKPVSSLLDSDKSKLAKSELRLINLQTFRTIDERAPYRHFCKVVQRLWDDRQMYDTVRALYAGDTQKEPNEFPPPVVESTPLENPTRPVVDIDIEYVEGVVSVNSFDTNSGKGFYAMPSLINHSCLPTANREFFGDAFVLRATQDMKKGDEVTIAYLGSRNCYDERQFRLLNSWGFSCSCKLCEADEEDGYDARARRRSLIQTMEEIGMKTNNTFDIATSMRLPVDAKTTCEALRKTYKAGHSEKAGGIKPELAQPLRLYANTVDRMGRVTYEQSYLRQAMELKMESLTISGLRVTDRSMAGALPGAASKKGQKLSLPVDTSRVSGDHDISIITVLEIAKLFREFGDQKRAKLWFDVALWLENVQSGGGTAVFKLRNSTTLTIFEMNDFL